MDNEQNNNTKIFSLSSILQKWWKDKHPFLLYLMTCIGLLVVFYAFLYTSFYNQIIHPVIVIINAKFSAIILNIMGFSTSVKEASILSNEFAINIKKGCDAVEAIGLFSIAIIAFPTKINFKIRGLLIGIFLLFLLNLGRIVGLFLTGIYLPKWFDFMHVEVGQFVFMLVAIALFAYWIKWINEKK